VAHLSMSPLQARRMRLEHASHEDAAWLCAVIDRASQEFGTRLGVDAERNLVLHI
jgi:hypothetical protein